MSKYTPLVVCALCISLIGYISWDLLTKKSSESTELSGAQQDTNELPNKEDIPNTNNTQKSDTSKVNNVVTLKSDEGSSVSVDSTKLTVSNEQFMKNLSSCTASIYTDKDYGLYPSDLIESELTTLEWSIEILDSEVDNCKVTFNAFYYSSTDVKQLEKTTQCTFDFYGQTDDQIRNLYKDAGDVFSFNTMTVVNPEKLSPAEKKLHDAWLQNIATIDKKELQEYTELDPKNVARISCAPTSLVVLEQDNKTILKQESQQSPVIEAEKESNNTAVSVTETIKKILSGLRSKAELHYNQDYTYAGLCSSESVISELNKALTSINGETYVPNVHGLNSYVAQNIQQISTASCHVYDSGYVIVAPVTTGSGFWCVDSTGVLKQTVTPPAANSFSCT